MKGAKMSVTRQVCAVVLARNEGRFHNNRGRVPSTTYEPNPPSPVLLFLLFSILFRVIYLSPLCYSFRALGRTENLFRFALEAQEIGLLDCCRPGLVSASRSAK